MSYQSKEMMQEPNYLIDLDSIEVSKLCRFRFNNFSMKRASTFESYEECLEHDLCKRVIFLETEIMNASELQRKELEAELEKYKIIIRNVRNVFINFSTRDQSWDLFLSRAKPLCNVNWDELERAASEFKKEFNECGDFSLHSLDSKASEMKKCNLVSENQREIDFPASFLNPIQKNQWVQPVFNSDCQRGIDNEQPDLDRFTERTKLIVTDRNKQYTRIIIDQKSGFDIQLIGSIDGIVERNGEKILIETKNRREFFPNSIPTRDLVQIMSYMFLTGIYKCIFLQNLGKVQREIEVNFDEKMWKRIEKRLKIFTKAFCEMLNDKEKQVQLKKGIFECNFESNI